MSPAGLNLSDAPGIGDGYLTLANIVGGGVTIEWFEAVAVARAVAETAAVSNDRAIPELNQIQLHPTGIVTVVGAAIVDEPVRRLGQLLQALIAQADAPVQLRLMITQATSPAPLFASVREYADGLAYFERPDRLSVLRALYDRAAAASVAFGSSTVPTLDDFAPLPAAETEKPAPPKPKTAANPLWRAVAGLVIVTGAAAGGVWLARRQGVKGPSRSQMTAIADRASGTLGSAVVSGASAVTETLGLGRLVPADAPPGQPPAPPPSSDPPAAKRDAKPASPRTVDARSMPGLAFDLTGSKGKVIAGDTVYEGVVTDDNGHTADASEVFGPASDGVDPPVSVEPRLPRELPANMDPRQLGRIELVIAVDGSVESAKLIGPPRNIKDAMFLSVAKAWQFQPARKDGVPVRYRKTIWIASQ